MLKASLVLPPISYLSSLLKNILSRNIKKIYQFQEFNWTADSYVLKNLSL